MDSCLRQHLLRCLALDLELAPTTGRIVNWAFVARRWRDPDADAESVRQAADARRALGRQVL